MGFGDPPLLWQIALGVWLVGIAANYVPLLLYSIAITRQGAARTEGQSEMPRLGRYRVQQSMLIVPFLAFAVAIVQKRRRRDPRA
jgi:hypothetical protein